MAANLIQVGDQAAGTRLRSETSFTAKQVLEDNLDTAHWIPATDIPLNGSPWTTAIMVEEHTTWAIVYRHLGAPARSIPTIVPPRCLNRSQSARFHAWRWVHGNSVDQGAWAALDFPNHVIAPGSDSAVILEFPPEGAEVIDDQDAWVQIRHDKKHPRESYWHIEGLVASFPSFCAESEAKPEVGDVVLDELDMLFSA
ncbi:hypothetical protein BU15DRAFT_64531 [Melanogaster broomeanus]|nr:hypothetical protein BU15DRAFT_64531 [Melanogaster broomeanus]